MSSEQSPLLSSSSPPQDIPQPSTYYVDVPITKGFARSPQRSSFVSGSLGRQGLADGFFKSISPNGSYVAADLAIDGEEIDVVTTQEAAKLAREQQTLLADNHIPYARRKLSSNLEDVSEEVRETAKVWGEAVTRGQVNTSVKRELVVLAVNSAPLIVTFSLQYSLVVASIFSVGHLGKTELGAVSLASMTASITGFAMIQGLATCLDTLCAQAYGAGNFYQVGVYFQKCVAMIMVFFIPVAVLWFTADSLIDFIVPEHELAVLAMEYLRVVSVGIPGYILFECGKRFVQAQGNFHASTMVLLICSPVNIVLNYVLVWNDTIGMGFHGAAVAVAITDWLMAILLFLYVYFIDGRKCWNGISQEMFSNWGPMLKLAIPGVVMVEAEFMAFEVLTLGSSYFGTTALAAQSVLSTVTSLVYQIPFAVSIACSTRVANFIGATLASSAKTTAKISIYVSYLIALFNAVLLYVFRYEVGGLFSSDQEVIERVAQVFPLCAFMQIFDASGAVAGGVLRGQGRQHIGGYLNLFFYYVIALPVGFMLAFYKGWELEGLWTGVTIGVACISVGEIYYIATSNWDSIIQEARERTREERIMA
jgi:MATE family multidrug resistance protein